LELEEHIKDQINILIERAKKLKEGDPKYHQVLNEDHRQECAGWIASALNVVQLICPDIDNAYRKRADKIENKNCQLLFYFH